MLKIFGWFTVAINIAASFLNRGEMLGFVSGICALLSFAVLLLVYYFKHKGEN